MIGVNVSEVTRLAITALSATAFEQLTYALVRAIHPHLRRLRAPDGGADLLDDGPPKRVWQVKHHREINWSECRASLHRAAKYHTPERVTFVFPHDLTGREEKQFQNLRNAAPAGIDVDAVTFSWLNEELNRPELVGLRNRLLASPSYSLLSQFVTMIHPPVIPRYWTPRNDLLLTMDEWWRDRTENILVLIGLGGSGKSTLVQRWLQDVLVETETGELEGLVQFSLYEHGDRPFQEFVHRANRALGAPISADDEVDVLLELLEGHRVLLVLDGAERLLREYATAAPELIEERDHLSIPRSAREIVDEAAWRFLVGAASRKMRGRVLLTTRLMPGDLDEAASTFPVQVGGLTGEQAVALLRSLGIDGSDSELESSAQRFGGHPLSLARLANVLRADPIAPGDVRRAPRYEKVLDLRRRRRHIFDRAFVTLPLAARRILFIIAASRGIISGADLSWLASADGVTATGEILGQLVDEMWLDLDIDGNIHLHSVARRWLAARDPDSRRTHQLQVDLWQPRAQCLDLRAVASSQHARLADLKPATELVFHLARAGRYSEAWQMLDGELSAILAGRFAAHSVRSELLLEFFPENDENKEPMLADLQGQGSLLNSLANDLTFLGEPARAIPPLERAVQLARCGSSKSLAVRLGNLALTRIRIGQLAKASTELCEQQTIGSKEGDLANVLVAMQEHARLNAICGRYLEAEKLLDDSDALITKLAEATDQVLEHLSPIGWKNDRKRQYIALNRKALGAAYRALWLLLSGRDAREAAQIAVRLADESGQALARTRASALLGASLAAIGEVSAAREMLAKLLNEVGSIGIPEMEPELLTAIAETWLHENPARAADFAELSRRRAQRNGNRLQLTDALLVAARAVEGTERKLLAEEARKTAWCDGPPFYYASAVSAAENLLQQE